jgi:hypothetical protein
MLSRQLLAICRRIGRPTTGPKTRLADMAFRKKSAENTWRKESRAFGRPALVKQSPMNHFSRLTLKAFRKNLNDAAPSKLVVDVGAWAGASLGRSRLRALKPRSPGTAHRTGTRALIGLGRRQAHTALLRPMTLNVFTGRWRPLRISSPTGCSSKQCSTDAHTLASTSIWPSDA